MNMQQRKLQIIIQDLGRCLRTGEGKFCLDLVKGEILPWESVSERDDAGEGRPALKGGKRYLRIPAFDEMFAELKKRHADAERELDKEEAKTLPKDRQSDFLGFSDILREEGSEQEMALRWIASLHPSFAVEMVDEEAKDEPDDPISDYVLFRYDPASGRWSYA